MPNSSIFSLTFARWVMPVFVAIVVLIVLLTIGRWDRYRQAYRIRRYRHSYLRLVSRIERQTIGLRRLGDMAPFICETKLLDCYESCLGLIENLLLLFKRIEPFGHQIEILYRAHYLLDNLENRSDRTQKAFSNLLKGGRVNLNKLNDIQKAPPQIGCYFCSRPFTAGGFAKVQVKLEGEIKQVSSCASCRETLSKQKRVKVLFLLKDGKPVHWTEIDDYSPVRDFWDSTKNGIRKTQRLELVLSTKDETQPNRGDKDGD